MVVGLPAAAVARAAVVRAQAARGGTLVGVLKAMGVQVVPAERAAGTAGEGKAAVDRVEEAMAEEVEKKVEEVKVEEEDLRDTRYIPSISCRYRWSSRAREWCCRSHRREGAERVEAAREGLVRMVVAGATAAPTAMGQVSQSTLATLGRCRHQTGISEWPRRRHLCPGPGCRIAVVHPPGVQSRAASEARNKEGQVG